MKKNEASPQLYYWMKKFRQVSDIQPLTVLPQALRPPSSIVTPVKWTTSQIFFSFGSYCIAANKAFPPGNGWGIQGEMIQVTFTLFLWCHAYSVFPLIYVTGCKIPPAENCNRPIIQNSLYREAKQEGQWGRSWADSLGLCRQAEPILYASVQAMNHTNHNHTLQRLKQEQ